MSHDHVMRVTATNLSRSEDHQTSNIKDLKMLDDVHYDTFAGTQVTNSILNDATKLFSEHYAIWGEHSHNPGNIFPCTLPSYL